jgi:hypothetical protein
MFAKVKQLRYQKTENTPETCEDALASNVAHGLFVVADGVGTAMFAYIWSHLLTEHFCNIPLMSNDPFEIEWWLQQIQPEFLKQVTAREEKLDEIAKNKLWREGSRSTLATLRLTQVNETSTQGRLLVFGDSCVLVRHSGSAEIVSFPLTQDTDFSTHTVCLPSRGAHFDRDAHGGEVCDMEIRVGSLVILATDEVAHWIIGGAAGSMTPEAAFDQVITQTEATWPEFIQRERNAGHMKDDDSTALIVQFSQTADATSQQVGYTSQLDQQVIAQRKAALQEARAKRRRDKVAIFYGDGTAFTSEPLPQEELSQARQVADALKKVNTALNDVLNGPQTKLQTAMREIWSETAHMLVKEPAARQLHQHLIDYDVISHEDSEAAYDQLQQAFTQNDDAQIARTYAQIAHLLSVLSPEEQERIEQAEHRIHDLLTHQPGPSETSSDVHIVDFYRDNEELLQPNLIIQDQQRWSSEYQQRLDLTTKRITVLQHFRTALASRDNQQIVNSYDPVLDDTPLVQPDEHNRLQEAREYVSALQEFRKALGTEKDGLIIEQYCPSFTDDLTPEERKRVDWARKTLESRLRLLSSDTNHESGIIARFNQSILRLVALAPLPILGVLLILLVALGVQWPVHTAALLPAFPTFGTEATPTLPAPTTSTGETANAATSRPGTASPEAGSEQPTAIVEPTDPATTPTEDIATARPMVDQDFEEFWSENGGEEFLGRPITPPLQGQNNGAAQRVQWFEYARMEADAGEVSLGLLGTERLKQLPPPTATATAAATATAPAATATATDCEDYNNYEVCGTFLSLWKAQGEVTMLGLPLGVAITEDKRTIQWFERARLEQISGSEADIVTRAKLGLEILCNESDDSFAAQRQFDRENECAPYRDSDT